jgi:hypothetical protein
MVECNDILNVIWYMTPIARNWNKVFTSSPMESQSLSWSRIRPRTFINKLKLHLIRVVLCVDKALKSLSFQKQHGTINFILFLSKVIRYVLPASQLPRLTLNWAYNAIPRVPGKTELNATHCILLFALFLGTRHDSLFAIHY